MKIKQHLYITDPIAFLRGDYSLCFNLYDNFTNILGWVYAGEIMLDVQVDMTTLVQQTLTSLDEKETEYRATLQTKLAELEEIRGELRAITHQPGDVS